MFGYKMRIREKTSSDESARKDYNYQTKGLVKTAAGFSSCNFGLRRRNKFDNLYYILRMVYQQ